MATRLQKAQNDLTQLQQRASEIAREYSDLESQAAALRESIGNGIANGQDTAKQEAELDRIERRLKVMSAGQDAINTKLANQLAALNDAQHEADNMRFDELQKQAKDLTLETLEALVNISNQGKILMGVVGEIEALRARGVERSTPYATGQVAFIQQTVAKSLSDLLSDSQLKTDPTFAELGKGYARIW